MAADDCSLLHRWMLHSSLFARDNEALNRTRRISVSNYAAATSSASDGSSAATASTDTLSASTPSSSPFHVNRPAANELPARRRRGGLAVAATGRVAKRKPRASKRTPTMYINAEPANFKEMVQRVTGFRTSADVGKLTAKPLPLPLPPAFEIRAMPDLQQIWLPTLDTSAFFLDRPGPTATATGRDVEGFYGPVVAEWPGSEVDAYLSTLQLPEVGVFGHHLNCTSFVYLL